MTDAPSRKRRRPAAKVLNEDAVSELLGTALTKPQATVAFVIPTVKKMLTDAKKVVAVELDRLVREGNIGDGTGQRIRNLTATLGSIMDSEKKALEGNSGFEGSSPAQLAKALREEADRVEGVSRGQDAEED